ncbi:MAG TPA: hypothetical protein VIS31_07510 [Woeseiaceae bacterium]
MKQTGNPNPLRLRKRHGTGEGVDITPDDGARLVAEQSVGRALIAAIVAVFVFCLMWVLLSSLSNRVFPWMTVVLGIMVGLGVRRAGRGVDWRFPALAAAFSVMGALAANIVVAASVTADEFGTGTMDVLRAVTGMTWPVFFDEVMNAADGFYAAVAAGVAAFLAHRRLDRAQYYALRVYRDGSDRHQ